MTTNKCPTSLECPEILSIIEPCLSTHENVLDADVVEKVISTCAACIEPPNVLRRDNWVGKNVGYLLEKSIQYLHYRRPRSILR